MTFRSSARVGAGALVVVLVAAIAAAAEPADKLLRDAETYYWFGVAEKGDMDAFARGLALVQEARVEIERSSNAPAERDRQLTAVDALQSDLEEQAEMAHDTLYGVFPLVRLLAPSLFADAQATRTFELIDEPDVVAVTSAGEELARGVFDRWSSRPQLAVVFRSEPPSRPLENELRYIFNSLPKYRVRSRFDLAERMSAEQLAAFDAGALTGGLGDLLDVPEVLVVTVRKRAEVGSDYFFDLRGAVYSAGSEQPSTVAMRMGFCRDRRSEFWPVATAQAVLALLAVLTYAGLARTRRHEWPGRVELAVVPFVAFAVGRLAPWVLVPIAERVAPPAETLAKLSFWWPAGVGLVLVGGALLIYRGAASRVPHLGRVLPFEGRGGAVAGAVALGALAYLAVPAFLYLGDGAVSAMIPAVVLGFASAVLVGSALDAADPVHPSAGAVGAIGLLALGASVSHLGSGPLWAAAVLGLSAGVVILLPQLHREAGPVMDNAEGPRTEHPVGSLEDLAQQTAAPPYQPLRAYSVAHRALEPFEKHKQTTILALTGPGGRGKTATARAVVAYLRKALRKDCLQVLEGACPQPLGEPTPYAPFREALAEHFGLNLLAPPGHQTSAIDAAVDGIFDSVVPFSGLLFPSSGERPNQASSRTEVFLAILRMLQNLSRKAPVILFLDDLQWIDEASRELLRFLLERLQPGGEVAIAIILTGQDAEQIRALGVPSSCTSEVMRLSDEERTAVLREGLGLETRSARIIAGYASVSSGAQGEMFWLFQIVAHLAREGALEPGHSGFQLHARYLEGAPLPVPEAYQEAIRELLESFPEHRQLLECAACTGMEFDADVLARSLETPRLPLLRQLDQIEEDMGVIYDLRESDDVYAFRSSFVLETLRKEMRVSVGGPRARTVPQIIREYHARLARTLEGTLSSTSGEVYAVARHFYAAGAKHAAEAVHYCLEAARAASNAFDHSSARRYLAMARECAEVSGESGDIAEESLLLECRSAHVEQSQRQQAADQALGYMATHPQAPMRVLVTAARACYDAGLETQDQRYYAEAVRLGELVVHEAKTAMQRSEGHHFIGISLPTDKKPKERLEHLRTAFGLLEGAAKDDFEVQALRARVANSLAEQLSYGSPENKAEARRLFELSLELKERPELRDLAGLARSHGGLGRLAFFIQPPDLDVAEFHFRTDLELSEKIGDLAGQTKMRSLLGACSLLRGDAPSARSHYALALELAEAPIDVFFAGTGVLRTEVSEPNVETIDAVAGRLVKSAGAKGEIPRPCREELAKALNALGDLPELAELRRLVRGAAS